MSSRQLRAARHRRETEGRVVCALTEPALTPAELAERSGLHISAVRNVLWRWNMRQNPPAYYRGGVVKLNYSPATEVNHE